MRILVLGGGGMLGHALLSGCSPRHDVRATLRGSIGDAGGNGLLTAANSYENVDVRRLAAVARVLDDFHPEAAVNAVGLVKQRAEGNEAIPSIEVNALFPHRLAALCAERTIRLVHLSTDCVFSGRRGAYREVDPPDPVDLYGRSKLLGELGEPPALTLRTSMIGRELRHRTGLLEWFLAQRGAVRGFTRAVFSGLTTPAIARLIERILVEAPDLSGIWHVGAAAVSKHDLLAGLERRLGRPGVTIVPDDSVVCDRSLDSSAFEARLGWFPPSWEEMLDEMAAKSQESHESQGGGT